MFPIRDTIPSRHVPVMTWTLIGVNVAVFVLVLLLPEAGVQGLYLQLGVVPLRFVDPAAGAQLGLPGPSPIPLFTSLFLHGGFLHVLFNMWTLWIFGDNVEDRMGPFRFLVFYLTCGVAATLLHLFTHPSSTVPTVGASGAIAGVLGAYLVLYPSARVITVFPILFYPLIFELPAVLYLGFWFLTQLLSGFASFSNGMGGVAWWAHVGGFVAGILLFRLFLTSRRRPPGPGEGRHYVMVDLPRRSWRRL